jgi:hypothetical protein
LVDIYFPAGVNDAPLRPLEQYEFVENGQWFNADGGFRAAPRAISLEMLVTATYPMSHTQFTLVFLPWWQARKTAGGADNGMVPFWMRDPITRVPFRFMRQEGQVMKPDRDGWDWLVRLPLRRLAS